MRTSLSRSMGVSVLILCTTYEDSGTGEDTDMFVRIHRFMLLRRMNGSKTLLIYTVLLFMGRRLLPLTRRMYERPFPLKKEEPQEIPKVAFATFELSLSASCDLFRMRLSASRVPATSRPSVARFYYYDCFGASEATILSKRGSPRKASQNGSNFNSP